ncbi:NnrU family protein [Sphingomonas sabuli]|nr:NnrU family protein [Sphingomonas sabuli]
MSGLILASIAFVGTHFAMSHPLRDPLVRRLGERGFQGLYSLVALILFGLMIWFYRAIGDQAPIWSLGQWAWIAGALLMWLAAILFAGSFSGNPAMVAGKKPVGPPRGALGITRHPMMWSFAIWAVVHAALSGTTKALVLDGAIAILALLGAAMQDRKKASLHGDNWHEWTARTAFVPFGRGVANPGAVAIVAGTFLFLLATWLHPAPVAPWLWIG